MIKKEDARTLIVREWLKKSEVERTGPEAAIFAFQMMAREDLKFRCSGDPYQVIKGWLNRYLAPKTGLDL